MLVDNENIALTSCKDRIRINNIGGNKVEGELKGRDGEDVRSIFWNNSLFIMFIAYTYLPINWLFWGSKYGCMPT